MDIPDLIRRLRSVADQNLPDGVVLVTMHCRDIGDAADALAHLEAWSRVATDAAHHILQIAEPGSRIAREAEVIIASVAPVPETKSDDV